MTTDSMPITPMLVKAAATGASAYGVMSVLGPTGTITVPAVGGVSVPTFAAGAAATASVASDLAHTYVFPHLGLDQKYDATESAVTSVAVDVGSFYALAAATNQSLPGELGMATLAATAVVSGAVGNYLYATLLKNMVEGTTA
jgi:hypothetical protein